MSKTVTTTVIVGSVNHISDEEEEELLDSHSTDDLSEVAASMEESVEAIMARQFSDADDLPILDVSTDVYDDWSGEELEEIRG